MTIILSIYLIIVLLNTALGARFNTVGSQNQDQYIRLKSQYDLLPGKVVNLPIEVPQEYISLNGLLAPRIKSISSSNLDGIYGTGDIILIDLEYSSRVGVYQSPSLTLNTGCHDASCTIIEKQMFICAADRGMFAMRLEDEFLMNIDVNTTKEELKKLIQNTFTGINVVTITYSDAQNRTYNQGNRACSSIGNKIIISFDDVSLSQYNGDVPLLQVDATNTYADIHNGINIGIDNSFLQGVPHHSRSYYPKLSAVTEVVKGLQISDAAASYYSGDQSNMIRFKYVVQNGDFTERLEVKLLNYNSGYLYGLKTKVPISTDVPYYGSGTRYMSPVSSALGFNHKLVVTSAQPQITSITSPNTNGVYTQGDIILVHIIYDIPVKVFDSNKFLLQLSTGSFDRQIPFIQLISGNTILEFQYTVQEGDTSTDLDYSDSTSFSLKGGYIYRDTSTNETVANILLPQPGNIGSLAYNKMLVINTLSPQIVSINAVSREGVYTGGDLIDFEVLYGTTIHVEGRPRLLIQNTPSMLNANVLTAPFNPNNAFNRAKPGLDAQILISVYFNWDLSPGDEIYARLPGFYVRNEPVNGILNLNRTLYLQVLFNDVDQSSHFSGVWRGFDETLSITSYVSVPRNYDITIIVYGSSGLFGPSNGLYSDKFEAILSVASYNSVDVSFTQNYKFEYITSIGFESASLDIEPLMPGAFVTYLVFVFNVSEPLEIGDTIVLHLDGLKHSAAHSFTNVLCSGFYLSWHNGTYEFKLEVISNTTKLSYSIDILGNGLSFSVPSSGMDETSVTVSSNMQHNGQLSHSPLSSLNPICSVTQLPQGIFPTVKYLTKLPTMSSSVSFEWQNGLRDLLIGDTVVFELPDYDHALGTTTRSISGLCILGLTSKFFQVEIAGRKITFKVVEIISRLSLINVIIDQSVGLIVPTNGIRPLVDSFTFLIQSSNCNMIAATPVLFSYDAHIMFVKSPVVILLTLSGMLELGESVAIDVSFEVSESLETGDMFTITVPDFTQDFLSHPNGILLSSNANLTLKMNFLKQLLEFTVMSSFSVVTTSTLQLYIDYTQGFYLPKSSLRSDAFRLSIISNSVFALENMIMKTSCSGFCRGDAVYSTQFLNETLSIEVYLAFSADLNKLQSITFPMNGFKLSSSISISSVIYIDDSANSEVISFIKWSYNTNTKVKILELLLPSGISALTNFKFVIQGLELFENSAGISDNFAVFTEDKFIGNSSFVLNYPVIPIRKFYFIQSKLMFSQAIYISDVNYSNATLSFQLPSNLILDEGNFVEVNLPGFFFNYKLSYDSYADFLIANMRSQTNSYYNVIDLDQSVITLNAETATTIAKFYLRYKLFGDETLEIKIDNVAMPIHGVSNDGIVNGISYKIGISPVLITTTQYFTDIQEVLAITDVSVDFSFVSRSNFSLNNITVSFYSSTLIHLGDDLQIQIPGLGLKGVSNNEVTVELLSSSFLCNAKWFLENSTIQLSPISSSLSIGSQQIVINAFHPYRFYLKSAGIPNNVDSVLSLYSKHLDRTISVYYKLPCIAICSAVVIPEVRKAGFPTSYDVILNFARLEFSTTDRITMKLEGFSMKNYNSINIFSIDTSNNKKYALTISMDLNSMILSLDFTETFKQISIETLSFVIPQSFGLISPTSGIRSDYRFDVSLWTFSPSLNRIEQQYSDQKGSVSVIGKIKTSSFIVSPKVPGSVAEISFSFSFFDELLSGDCIRIYLPFFHVPTYQLVNTEFTNNVLIEGINGKTDEFSNPDGSTINVDHITQLRVTLLQNIAPEKELIFSIGNFSHISIPKTGIYHMNTVPWMAVESSTSPIASAYFLNYTRIGSLSPTVLNFKNATGIILNMDVNITISCPLFTNDIIFIHIFNVIPDLLTIPKVSVYSSSLNFTGSWDSQTSEIKLTIVHGTYIMSGSIAIQLTLEGFHAKNQISYLNDKRNTIRLQSSICSFESTSFDKSNSLFLSDASISFDSIPSINQPTMIGLSFIPVIDLRPFDILELKLPHFYVINDTIRSYHISSNGVFYDSGIGNYSLLLNETSIYAIIKSPILAETLVYYEVLKSLNYAIYLPPKGVSEDDEIKIELKLLRPNNATDLMHLNYLSGNTVIFQGTIQNIQPVMYFDKKTIIIRNPLPGTLVTLNIEWILSQSIPPSSVIILELPGFVCGKAELQFSGSAKEYFTASWNKASSSIYFTNIIMLPKFLLINAQFNLDQQFVSPIHGIPQENVKYFLSVFLNNIERLREEILTISIIPNVKASLLSFISSESSDSFNIAGDPYIIQLKPGHELTEQDQGAQIIISGDFYTIQTVKNNLIYLLEPYNGIRVFMGYPTISIYTPPYRFAEYFSGSGSTSLIFQYRVRRGDNSTALIIFKPTLKYNTNNADETLDLNSGFLLRDSNSPSLAADVSIPRYNRDTQRSVNSETPYITKFYISSPTGVYSIDQQIDFQVQYSERVLVGTTTESVPELLLKVMPSGKIIAHYKSGSGTNTLVFTYSVSASDFNKNIDSSIISINTPIYQPLRPITGNTYNYIRRYSDEALIDTQVDIGRNGMVHIDIPYNISLTGNAIKVKAIWTPMRKIGTSFSVGDNIVINVLFTDAVIVVNPGSSAPFILLEVGRSTPGIASYHSKYNDSTLSFVYQVMEDDELFHGLFLNCTCLDYFQRTFIQLGNSLILGEKSSDRVSVLLASDSSTTELRIMYGNTINSTFIIDKDIPYILGVNSNLSSDSSIVYSPGTIASIYVKFSKPVTVRGLLRIWMKAQLKPCPARYFKGNGSDTLTFLYLFTEVSGISTLEYVDINAFDTSMGKVYRYSDHPSMIVNTLLPKPGTPESLGLHSPSLIDTSLISLNNIDVIQSLKVGNKPYFSANSFSFNLYPGDSNNSYQYFPEKIRNTLLPVSFLFENCSITNIIDSWRKYSSQSFDFLNESWTGESGVNEYNRMQISVISQNPISFLPTLRSLMSLQAAYFDSYWWSNVQVRSDIELSFKFSRPVLLDNVFIELITGATSILNRAFSNKFVHQYFLTVQSISPYDINGKFVGSVRQNYRLKYNGYMTRCISVTADAKSVYSLQMALEEISVLLILEPNVILMNTQNSGDNIISYYRIDFVNLPEYELQVITGAELGDSCSLPVLNDQVNLNKENSSVTFTYDIKGDNSIVFKSRSTLAAGDYTLFIDSSNLIAISAGGVNPHSFQLKRYDKNGQYITKSNIVSASVVPQVRRSALAFTSAIPNTPTSLHINLCFDVVLNVGDKVIVHLYDFDSVWDNQILQPISLVSSSGNVNFIWDHQLSTLQLVLLKNNLNCISENVEFSFGFVLPSRSIYRNSLYFTFEIESTSDIGVKLPPTLFEFVSPVGIGSCAITFSDPRPYHPTSLLLDFSLEVDTIVNNSLNSYNSSTLFELYLPGFHTENGYSGELTVRSDLSVYFMAYWSNYTSTLSIWPMGSMSKGEYQLNILSEDSKRFRMFFPSTGLYKTNPPLISFISDQWSSVHTIVHDIPYIYGHESSFINLTLCTGDLSSYSVKSIAFGVNFSRPIDGPAFLNITMPFLSSNISKLVLLDSSDEKVTWYDWEKTLCVSKIGGWSLGFALVEFFDLTGFSVNEQGVPLKRTNSGITFSVVGTNGFLLATDVSYVTRIPVIQYSAVSYSSMSNDIFSSEQQTITIHIKLNLPSLPLDLFFFDLSGIQSLNESNAVISDPCVSINENYWSHYLSEPHTLVVFLLNSSICMHRKLKYTWIIKEKSSSDIDLRSVVQYNSGGFEVSWVNTYRNIQNFKIIDYPVLGLTASSLEFSNPCVGQVTDMSIRLLTASVLLTNDVIHMQIPHVIFNLTNADILDQYGRKWIVYVENVVGGFSNISFVVPKKLSQTSLYFHITNCILFPVGIEANTKEITISLKRGSHMPIRSQMISKFLTPVGYINSFKLYPVRSMYYEPASMGRKSSLGFMVIIDTLSILNTGDVIYIELKHYNFHYDSDLKVDGKDSTAIRVRSIQNKNTLEVTILESIESTLLQFTILPNDAIAASDQLCSKNLCDVSVSVDSKSNPVCRQNFEAMEIFTLTGSMFNIFQNNTNIDHRNVSLEVLIPFRNTFRKGSVLSIHLPDVFDHKDIYFSFLSLSQSQWNLVHEGKFLNQTIQLKATSDILPGNSTRKIVLESNMLHSSSSHIIYENDPSIYYQVFPFIESVHEELFQYYSEIGHFATAKSYGLKNSSLVLSNSKHGHKTAIIIDLQSDIISNFHVGDNISIALKDFVLFTGMDVVVNTTNSIAVIWNPVTEAINIHVHKTCSSISLVAYWFVVPLMGSNTFSSLPTLSISTITGFNFIDSTFNIFKQLAPQLKVQFLFSRLLVSQESVIFIHLNGDLHLTAFDQFLIYLPQFWCSSRASLMTVNSTSNSFIATWDVSSETLILQSMNISDTMFLVIEVEGLRVPYDGISSMLVDFVTFKSNSTRSGYIEVSNIDMQLIGSMIDSTLLFSPGRLGILNDLHLTFEFNVAVHINGTINLHIPGFVVNTLGGGLAMINSTCTLTDEVITKEQLYQVYWNFTAEILSLKAKLRSLDPFERCVVIIKNVFQLPSNGIYLASNHISAKQSLSLHQIGHGSFDPTPIAQVHYVGFISASVSYDKFMDSNDQISFKLEFYPSVQIEVGDQIIFYLPLITPDDKSSLLNLVVLGDQAEKNFIPSFTVQFHRTNNEIVLTAVTKESSRYISISVTRDNNFRFVNDALKYANDMHYISGVLFNIGTITKREIVHSPKDFYGIESKLITLTNCSSTHTLYDNEFRGCLIRLELTVYSSLEAGESLVLSHPNLYRPTKIYDGLLNNYSSVEQISVYRQSLDHNLILNTSGNATDLFTSYWRPADNINNLMESSEEIYAIDSHALAFARTDLSFYEINKTLPITVLPENIQIVSKIPRIVNVYIQHKYSTGSYLSCEDVVEIVINFDIPVSVKNPEKLNLALNTGEFAGYNHGIHSSSLYFVYHIISPVDVLDLEILGPGALEYYLPDITSVFSLENSLIPANLTIPQPYNKLFLEDNQFKQLPVACKLTASVTEVSTYSSRFSIYATNDVVDIQVIFNRPITVIGNPYLVLSSSHVLNPTHVFKAEFVNVSNIQWLDVPLEGVFKLMYEGQTTHCIDVRNASDIHTSISNLAGLKYSLPLDISRFVVKNGYRYKLVFGGLAPSIIALSVFTCGYFEVPVSITIDKSLYNTAIFRYAVHSGDQANLLTYPNDSALVLPSDSIIYLTGRSLSTRVNANLPHPSSANSLLISSGVRIRTESPYVLSLYSNHTGHSALQSGDVVYILVNYSAPVVVIEPENVMLELNISSTLPSINDSFVLEKLSLCFVFENILYFKYVVRMGDYAKYLTTSRINMLYGSNQSILLKSINPITPALLILPDGSALFSGLTQSKVVINAIDLPIVQSVFTNHSVGSFNTGEEIFITVQFSAIVNIFKLITNHKVYPKTSPYITFVSPEDGFMLYVAGSGTSEIVFKHSVGEIKEEPSANISFHINLLQGYFQDQFYRNFTQSHNQNHRLFQIEDLVVSSEPAYVVKVDVTNPNGTYYPGETLDLFIVFSEPVLLRGGYSKPALELFLPTQSGSDLLAIYSWGNGTNQIHFEYVIPATNFNFLQQAPFVLDYSNADGLYKYLYGTKFTDISTHSTTEANVYLPTKDHSFLTHHRFIFVDFSICKIISVFSDSSDGIYTAGDVVSISVLFSSQVMIFYPPVLKLATGKVNRSAIYEKGNGTNTLTFSYLVKIGDTSGLLDYIDTRHAPYSLDYPDQSYALNTGVIPSINTLIDSETIIFLEASTFGGIYMLSSSTDASKRVAVYTALPIPGQQGSLSQSSKIVIDTTAPFIELVTTTLTSGTYGHDLSIPIYMLFSAPITIVGCPYIIFKVNGLEKTALYTSGNNSELVQFHYLVEPDNVIYSFDYFDRFSLKLAPCPQSPIFSVNSILRYSKNPQIFANLTMPWVRYVESVTSPVSIVGSGKDLNIIATSKNGPRLIWSSLTNIRDYSLGDVIDVNIGFGGSIIFPGSAYLNMKNRRIVNFASQVNDTTVTFPFVVQHLETLAALSYPDLFSLITLSSCEIISSSTNECVPQNLPVPFSTSPESSIDALSPLKLNVVQSPIVVELVYFIPSNDNTATFYTGSIINIVVQFSEAVLVQGNPLLILYLGDDLMNVYFNAYYNATQSSTTKLFFQAFIDSSIYYGQLSCNFNSIIDLNGGKIVREANFLPIVIASVDLSYACCKDDCNVHVEIESKVPVVMDVYSPQKGVYSLGERIDIFVKFNVPIKVIGLVVMKLELYGMPSAIYVETSQDNLVLQFMYIIKNTDYTSSLDYQDISSLIITSNGPYDGIYLLCPTGNISAVLTLPSRGSVGSLGRESSIVINTNRPNLLINFANPSKATSGDELYITLRYSEPMIVVNNQGSALFSRDFLTVNLDSFLGLSLDFIPTEISELNPIQKRTFNYFETSGTDIIFRYQVQASDPTGFVYFSSSSPIIFSNAYIKSALTGTSGPSEFSVAISTLLLATIDNNIPIVLQVYSPNKSSFSPFGVGDVIDIYVEMSLSIIVKEVPFLRLVLDNGMMTEALYSSDNPSPVKVLKFQYKVQSGNSAYPLEYDGNYALVGLLLRYSTYNPTIIANLYLPDPSSLGSLFYCCNLIVDSSPPHVVSLIPLKRAGVYGENEVIYIMARFSKPVIVTGNPELHLSTKVDENNEVIGIGVADYTKTINEYDIPIDIRDTDVLFKYVVKVEDNVISLHHSDKNAIKLNNGALIQHLTNNPTLLADTLLRSPGDFTVQNGIVDRQWKFRFPNTVEILLRDFYHTKVDSITAIVEHSGKTAILFKNCCSKKTFGYSYPKTRSGTNSTLQSLDTGMGEDFLFSDLVSSNIALQGIVLQSSTRLSARLAIDGNTDPLVGDNSVSETIEQDNAWWQVSLPINSTVQSLTIWPRKPQNWINPVVQMTIKSFDRYSDGKYRLRIQNIDNTDPTAEVLTTFIPMSATALQVKKILEVTQGLGNVEVFREELPLCPKTGQGCGAGGYQSGYGFRYDLSFLSLKTSSPNVLMEQITFPGEDVVTDPALHVPSNTRTSEFFHLIELTRTGYYIQVPEEQTYGKGVQTEKNLNTNRNTNEWLTPFWVFIFDIQTNSPPNELNASINSSIWYQRYEQIENSLNIVLTVPIDAKFVKVQREGFGSLSLAELQVFEERIDSLAYYNQGSPVRPSALSSPYQPEQTFKNTFAQYQFDGNWIVQLSQDDSSIRSPQGWSGASGTISEAVLIITDLAGIVHSYYQDLRAEVVSLPKYGTLLFTSSQTPSPYGDWREAFEIVLESQLIAKDGGERYLGYCFGPDSSGNASTINVNQAYTSCTSNFGVGPLLNLRTLGDTAVTKYLRNERIIVYRPRIDYLGPDAFTYIIHDGLNVQRHVYFGGVQSSNNEVLIHIRRCRPFQSRSQYALTSTQTSSFTSDGHHVLCACAQTETSMVGNRVMCDAARLAVCTSEYNTTDPINGRRQFLALCLTCTDPFRGLNSSDCQTQTIRAVSLLTSRNLCVPSVGSNIDPVMDCSMEIFTEPGKESNSYLTIKPPVLFGSFQRLKNSFGAYGWYHTPQLN